MAAGPLRESEHENTYVAGWESTDGTYHSVYDNDGDKIGRAPSDYSLEHAERIVIFHDGDWYTVGPFTEDYEIDEAIAEIEDFYSER